MNKPLIKKNKEFKQFSNHSTSNVQFKTGLFKLSFFYSIVDVRIKYLIAFITGIILSLATTLLIEITGLYSSGLTAFFQGIARAIHVYLSKNNVVNKYWLNVIYNLMFWGFYLVINIFLFIRYFNKMNHQCLYITIIFISTGQIFGFLLAFIPNLHTIMIFGDTSTVNQVLKEYSVQSILYSSNWFPTQLSDGSYDWTKLINIADIKNTSVINDVNNSNITKAFLLILYAGIYSLPTSYINSVLYIIGGSSGGSELASLYLSEKKNKNLGTFLKTIQVSSLIGGVFIGTYVTGIIIDPEKYCDWQYLLNANLVASIIWVFLNSLLISKMFQSRKLVRVEIFTSNLNNISSNLKKYKYTHPTTILNSIGGFLSNKNNILISVMQLIEIPKFVRIVRMVDKDSLITVTSIDDCDGKVVIQNLGLNPKNVKNDKQARSN